MVKLCNLPKSIVYQLALDISGWCKDEVGKVN